MVPPIVQVEPVKPLIHIHEQLPVERTEEPPFRHSVVELDWHCSNVGSEVDEVDLLLWKTKSSRGTTIAAAMIMRIIRRRRRNPHTGRPQQRRGVFTLSSSRAGVERSKGAGHDCIAPGVPT